MENSIITKKKKKTAKNSQKRQQPNATPFNCNVCYSVEFNKFMHLFMPPHHILVNLSAWHSIHIDYLLNAPPYNYKSNVASFYHTQNT